SLFFMFYNLWVWYSRTIMTEVHYVFFSMLSLLLLLYSFKTGHLRIKYLICSGMTRGCAFSSKLLCVEFSLLFAAIILVKGLAQSKPGSTIYKKQLVKVF